MEMLVRLAIAGAAILVYGGALRFVRWLGGACADWLEEMFPRWARFIGSCWKALAFACRQAAWIWTFLLALWGIWGMWRQPGETSPSKRQEDLPCRRCVHYSEERQVQMTLKHELGAIEERYQPLQNDLARFHNHAYDLWTVKESLASDVFNKQQELLQTWMSNTSDTQVEADVDTTFGYLSGNSSDCQREATHMVQLWDSAYGKIVGLESAVQAAKARRTGDGEHQPVELLAEYATFAAGLDDEEMEPAIASLASAKADLKVLLKAVQEKEDFCMGTWIKTTNGTWEQAKTYASAHGGRLDEAMRQKLVDGGAGNATN